MMNIRTTGMVAVLAVALAAAGASAVPYAQLSSTENQVATMAPKMVTLNQNDAAKGVVNSNGEITVSEAGSYFAIAAGQIGGEGKGNVKLWLKQNGKDVDNSNAEQTVTAGSTSVLVAQGVVECKAGDKLQLAFSATAENLGLVATKASGEPAIPSMIFSLVKVDAGAFAQLSSTANQAGAAKGTAVTLDKTDAAKGIENANGAVTIKDAGVYFVIAAGQVGGKGKGSVKMWLRQNGKDVDNSNAEQSVEGGSTAVLVAQGVAEFKAGDKVELMQSANGEGLGLVASTPKGEPAIPSVIFTAFKVPGKAYAQLSSLKKQAAGMEGKAVALESSDAAVGVENASGTVTVKEAGVYFVAAAAQVGCQAKDSGKGSVKLWIAQNGKAVDNSNAEQSVATGCTSVLLSQGVMELKAGDKIQLMQSAKGEGLGLVAFTPTGEPAVPSLILSLVKLD